MLNRFKTPASYKYFVLVCVLSYLFFSRFAGGTAQVLAQGGGCPANPLPRTCSGYAVCTSGGNCGQLAFVSCCAAGPYPTNTPAPTPTTAPTSTQTPTPTPTSAPYLLQAAYRFNNSGNLGQSSIGSGIDGTNTSVSYVTSGALDGGSGSFNGTSSYLSIADNAVFNQSAISVSAWANLTAHTAGAPLFNRRTAGDVGGVTLELDSSSNATCKMYINGAWRTASTAASSITTGTWFKLTCTYDGTNLKIYKDSVLANTTAISGTVNNPSSPSIWIGRNIVSSSVYLSGLVDEVCIYGKGLSSTEVTTLANSTCDGLQGAYPPVPTPTGGGTVVATGGTTTDVGGYRIHTFTSSGTFTVSQAGNVESLIVAGGGGGGNPSDRTGGGGGAGGLKYTASTAVTAQAYTVTVGNGGGAATNGNGSSALGITATGGGKGATGYGGGVGNGGSGGGCMHNAYVGTGTGGEGNNGGSPGYDSGNGSSGTFSACGGGGAGAVGGAASTITGGAGGVGLAYSISGASVYYAGGGGGGVQNLGQGGNVGVGGNGGGGNGGVNGSGSNGTANTGGGGGGAGSTGTGGTGGSGIVILKYQLPASTPTPSPTTAPITGCNAVTWSGGTNVTATGNTLVGNADSGSTTMSNGAQANFTAAQGTSPGGHAQVPSGTQSYRAMWGLSYTGTTASDIDFAWLLPYYNGSNKAYVSTPGNNLIDMGAVTAGDRYGVQVSGSQVVYTKLPAGSTTWQTMYVFSPTITYSLEFRGRVEDYAQVFNAFAGSSCQMVVVSTPTPSPTSSTGGGIAITPWYSQNLSTYPEFASHTYDDPNESGYVYMVGRRSIGYPFGWGQSSAGYVQKVRKSDKTLIWSRETGLTFSPPYLTGGLFDVVTDTSYVYVGGYDGWGTNLYVAKLNKSDGTIVWESSTYQGGSWNTEKAFSMALDASNIYVQGLPGPSDSDTSWQIMKKNKSDGATTLTREININNPGWDKVNALALSGTTLIAGGTTKQGDLTGNIYFETINTATMATISTLDTGTVGSVGIKGIVLDPGGQYFYAASFVPLSTPSGWIGNPDNTSTSQIRVEKRKISDLSLSWSYTTPQTTERQYNPGIAFDGTNIIVGFVNNIDYSTGYGSSMRLVRLNTSGTKLDDYLYYGPSTINSLSSDSSGATIYATGSTLNRAESAIYRMDGLYNVTPTPGFGLAVSQSTPATISQGSPIQWTVDIDNSSLASEAAWAFTFTASIPTQINGIVWSCAVINSGTAAGEMIGYPTRCSSVTGGSAAYDSGTGTNKFTFGHTSNADPLIQPGGKLRITISGVVAANTPAGTLNATMSITNYQGWPTDHYYTTNFLVVTGPTPLAGTPAPQLYTLSDSDVSNNQSILAMALGSPPPSTPTPTGPTSVPTLTATPTLTPSPTPIPPATVSSNCPGTYLRAIVDGQVQYYCRTADDNFVVIRGTTVEKLNGSGTKVTDVTFTNVGTVNGEQLIRVDFTIQSTTIRPGTTAPTSKTYSLTVRLR